jgi:hypothetical protein
VGVIVVGVLVVPLRTLRREKHFNNPAQIRTDLTPPPCASSVAHRHCRSKGGGAYGAAFSHSCLQDLNLLSASFFEAVYKLALSQRPLSLPGQACAAVDMLVARSSWSHYVLAGLCRGP